MGGPNSGRRKSMGRIFDSPQGNTQFSEGQKSKGILDDFPIRQNIDTAEGTIQKTPVNDTDIANKKYVDDNAGGTHTESSTDSLTNKTANSFTNDIFADHIHEEVRNESGSAMAIGDAVFISGFSVGQTLPKVDFADNGSAATMPCVGIIVETLANNATGQMVETGTVTSMKTDNWSVGDDLYVTNTGTTTNTLTSTKPTGTELIQKVAEVLRSHASNGVIEVFGAGRTNDLPNLPNTKIWIGDVNGVPQEFAVTGDITMTAGGVTAIGADKIINADVKSDAAIAISKTALVAGTNITLATNTLNVDDKFLKNDAVDIGVGLTLTGDNASADTNYVPMVLYNTDATPPTASNHPIGTIYIQYTA